MNGNGNGARFAGFYLTDRPDPDQTYRIDRGIVPMVRRMNHTGLYLDLDRLNQIHTRICQGEQEQLALVQAYAACELPSGSPDLNPGSGDQVAKLLFDRLGIVPPYPRLTQSGSRMSVDDEMLSTIRHCHPIVPVIQDWRQLAKLKTTYSGSLGEYRDWDGRVRTTLSITTARTGRLASSNPNLQNIPVRSDLGKYIRWCFTAVPGNVLVSIDLSQIEMVWAAHLSQDPTMLRVFQTGEDQHVLTAFIVFGEGEGSDAVLPIQGVNYSYDALKSAWTNHKRGKLDGPERNRMRYVETVLRPAAKVFGFAILYGTTPEGLALQVALAGGPTLTPDQAQALIRRWYSGYAGVRAMMQVLHARVLRTAKDYGCGYSWTAFGRPRAIPEVLSRVPSLRNAALRQAGNTPIQGSAGDHLKIVMIHLEPVISRLFPDAQWCLQVHDELIFEVPNDQAQDFQAAIKPVVESCVPLSVPVRASVSCADNWMDLK